MNSTLQLILSIVNVIVALIMIVLVLVQNGKSEGLDPFVGSKAETFFVICAVCFFVLTAVLAIFA